MKTLRSYVGGQWYEAASGFVPLVDPSTEEVVAQASSAGLDFGAVLAFARERGGPNLRRMTLTERGQMLRNMAQTLRQNRDLLLELSRQCNGTTAGDGSFDIDGASGVLSYYAGLAKGLGERPFLVEGEGMRLAKTDAFWGQHVLVPRLGVAVHINAFNFPAWGFAEKAACALLAGVPVITKPATATALVAERCVELLVDAQILPEGALQLICGDLGDLLDRLGPQDALAFTGSADTALKLSHRANLNVANTRINREADSLNAAVLAPGVDLASPTADLFFRDVVREITQKAGQKCTAVRRILVPHAQLIEVQERLAAQLAKVVTGNPKDPAVTMGPLATARQLHDAEAGVAALLAEARIVYGRGQRADGVGSPAGKGFFFPPTLLVAEATSADAFVHAREVFAPVSTLLPYDGQAEAAAEIVAWGGGTLVTSVYGDDPAWLQTFLAQVGSTTGRLYVGSAGSAAEAFGSGAALPQTQHGGPGRAGGGAELGGMVGLRFYLQRVALQGSRPLIDELVGLKAEQQ